MGARIHAVLCVCVRVYGAQCVCMLSLVGGDRLRCVCVRFPSQLRGSWCRCMCSTAACLSAVLCGGEFLRCSRVHVWKSVFPALCRCMCLCCALRVCWSMLCSVAARVPAVPNGYARLCRALRVRTSTLCSVGARVHAEMCGRARAFTVQGGCVCLCCALLGGKFLCCAARVRVCCVLWMPVPMLSPAGECLCYTVRVRVLHAVLCVGGMQVRVSVLHVSEHACCMLCSVGFVPMLCSEGTYLCYGLWVHACLLCSVCACPCAVLCGHMSML